MPPAGITIECVETPTENIVEEASQIFAELMATAPAEIALVAGDTSLIPSLGRVVLRPLVLTPGVAHMFAARDESGSLVGYTLFSLPGQPTNSEQQKRDLAEFTSKLSPEGQQYWSDVMGKEVPKATDRALGVEEAERNLYWCHVAMVRKEFQGKGIVRALFELATKEAAKTGTTMGLGTTNARNVAIYQKLGFTLCGEKAMPSPWADWQVYFFKKGTNVSGA